MTVTGLRRRSIGMPEAHGKVRSTIRISHSLAGLKEQFTCGLWWMRS